MMGTIVIRDVFGATSRQENKTHLDFMNLGENLDENTPILIVQKDRHTFINPRHVVSIEWVFN